MGVCQFLLLDAFWLDEGFFVSLSKKNVIEGFCFIFQVKYRFINFIGIDLPPKIQSI
jgi:hypothetical protein